MSIHHKLKSALNHSLWASHTVDDVYVMDGVNGWQLAYCPLFETYEGGVLLEFDEPRALVEKPKFFNGVAGIDFREVPLRYLKRSNNAQKES